MKLSICRSLTRVTRTLAQPDIIGYKQQQAIVTTPLYVPCPAGDLLSTLPEADTSDSYLTINPACAAPGETIQVEGSDYPTELKRELLLKR